MGTIVLVLAIAGGGSAQAPDDEALEIPPRRAAAEGAPSLDALLQLPSGFVADSARSVGGVGEAEWRRRFDKAIDELRKAQASLESTQRQLDDVAGTGGSSQWAVAPPGASNSGGASTGPLSFKLRQELARNRERLDEAEKALRELRIEADLAGVPAAWRGDADVPMPRRLPTTDHLN